MPALSQDQVAAFRRDGFLFPFPLLDEAERQECLAGLARYEAFLGCTVPEAEDIKWRTMPYACLPWANRLARDPRVLDVIESLIGPDILMWTSTFFIKEGNSPSYAAWHQDGTYFGHEPAEQVCAWIALTEASEEAGCMEVLSAGGHPTQKHHRVLGLKNSINRAGQAIVETLDDSRPVAMPLKAGEFSLHHTFCIHRSAPNRTGQRRIGLGLNFIPTRTRTTGSVRCCAMLVRGEDRYGHFELIEAPKGELDEAGLAAHDLATRRYRDNYLEQVERHKEAYETAA